MKILAWDLSSRQGSIGLAANAIDAPASAAQLVVHHVWPNDRRNSAPFFRVLDEIIRNHGLPDVIIVGRGPGSYTGTRIAISAAIGLQLTSRARLAGLPSLCAISEEDDYAVIGDAKRSSFFLARVSRAKIIGEIELLSELEMTERLSQTAGPIYTSDELPHFAPAQLAFPCAKLLCSFASEDENVSPLEPIYLRAPHITTPRVPIT